MSKIYTLENDSIRIKVNSFGAELFSIVKKDTDREYMWSGDPKYWGRVSPILFPLVGNYRDKRVRHEGKVYESGQHGFARDMEFVAASRMSDELWFVLNRNDETMKHYPFNFSLLIGYRLKDDTIKVMWNVMNHDNGSIHFSIGGHPAFNSLVEGAAIEFDVAGPLRVGVIGEGGTLSDRTKDIALSGGKLMLSHDMFDEDALIIEDQEISKATLIDENGKGVLSMSFDAPVLGVWTPAGRKAPFVCIEPWYGRTDRADFDGELKDREWGNTLKPGEVFSTQYEIVIL